MQPSDFPILEFDANRDALISAQKLISPLNTINSTRCVLSFFSEANQKLLSEHPHKIVSTLKSESADYPLYELDYKGRSVSLIQAGVGAPIAAAQIEELTALGFTRFIACGGCGVLQKELAVGHLIIPTSAVRDEGTSYHYIAPSREITANPRVIDAIEATLTSQNVPFIKAKTWTTDAMYRETPAKIALRKAEGCVSVEMETSAFFAVAEFLNVEFGQILYAGDNLDGEQWDSRNFTDRADIREYVLQLALGACLAL